MVEYVEGRKFLSKAYRKKQKDEPVHDSFEGTGRFAEQADTEDSMEVKVTSGRTVSLGNFSFARINIGMSIAIDDYSLRDEAYEAIQVVVDEIIAREEAGVRKEEREKQNILWDFPCKRRVIYVEYGLTLEAKIRYEFNKIDVGLSEPISDAADLEIEVNRIQEWLGEKITQERKKLQDAGKGDYGF